MEKINQLLAKLITLILRAYQYCISPFLGNCCRFYPSCSNYAIQAVRRFGLFYGAYLSLRRILRCHPFCLGGIDPLPEKQHK